LSRSSGALAPVRRRARRFLVAAAGVFALLVIDILVAKVQVMMGDNIPVHIGDVGQFVLLLVAVVLFVVGAVNEEELARENTKTDP
jgi:hypothetical protein